MSEKNEVRELTLSKEIYDRIMTTLLRETQELEDKLFGAINDKNWMNAKYYSERVSELIKAQGTLRDAFENGRVIETANGLSALFG